MSFKQVAENLVRNEESGMYYASAKVGGKKMRKSLKTKMLSLAKKRRDEMVSGWRLEAAGAHDLSSWEVLVEQVLAFYLNPRRRKEALKASSVKYYEEVARSLEGCFPGTPLNFTRREAEDWWGRYRDAWGSNRANVGLSFCKKMGGYIEKGAPQVGNVFGELRRVPERETVLDIPDKAGFLEIIAEIRRPEKVHSAAAGDFVEFLSYSGMRVGELKGLVVEDIREESIVVRGGVEGTKNRLERVVPIIQPMRDLLGRMEMPVSGPVFYFSTSPKAAIWNACDRLGVKRLSPHKFRHFFATICVESEVDYPTLALWMGHQDGGFLVAKRYSHIRNKHSSAMAARVRL